MDAFPTWVVQTAALALIGSMLTMRTKWGIEVPWWLIGTLTAIMSGSELRPKAKDKHNDQPNPPRTTRMDPSGR